MVAEAVPNTAVNRTPQRRAFDRAGQRRLP